MKYIPSPKIFGCIIILINFLFDGISFAQTESDLDLLKHWYIHLHQLSEKDFNQLKQIDPSIFINNIDRKDIYEVTIPSLRNILKKFSENGRGSMDFFANSYFCNSNKIFYFSRDVIRIINLEYDIASVFFVRGYTRKKYEMGITVIPDNTFFEMNSLLLGNGKLIAIYPFHISVHRDDPLFGFLTGNYEIYRFNIADISSYDENAFTLRNLRGRDQPDIPFKSVLAPFNLPIHELKVVRENPHRTHALLGHIWWNFDHPNMTHLNQPLYLQPAESINLPTTFIQESKQIADSTK